MNCDNCGRADCPLLDDRNSSSDVRSLAAALDCAVASRDCTKTELETAFDVGQRASIRANNAEIDRDSAVAELANHRALVDCGGAERTNCRTAGGCRKHLDWAYEDMRSDRDAERRFRKELEADRDGWKQIAQGRKP